jgi:hypothetical protein
MPGNCSLMRTCGPPHPDDQAGLPPVRRPVYTHHPGACAWEDVEIVAHESDRDPMAAEALRPWSPAYLQKQVAAGPRPRLPGPRPSGPGLGMTSPSPPAPRTFTRAQRDGLIDETFTWYVDSPWRAR